MPGAEQSGENIGRSNEPPGPGVGAAANRARNTRQHRYRRIEAVQDPGQPYPAEGMLRQDAGTPERTQPSGTDRPGTGNGAATGQHRKRRPETEAEKVRGGERRPGQTAEARDAPDAPHGYAFRYMDLRRPDKAGCAAPVTRQQHSETTTSGNVCRKQGPAANRSRKRTRHPGTVSDNNGRPETLPLKTELRWKDTISTK